MLACRSAGRNSVTVGVQMLRRQVARVQLGRCAGHFNGRTRGRQLLLQDCGLLSVDVTESGGNRFRGRVVNRRFAVLRLYHLVLVQVGHYRGLLLGGSILRERFAVSVVYVVVPVGTDRRYERWKCRRWQLDDRRLFLLVFAGWLERLCFGSYRNGVGRFVVVFLVLFVLLFVLGFLVGLRDQALEVGHCTLLGCS
uniref:(northern house mosquito) hypothetical protein n=1 Tax=Culex pipiens TaxID=7175 RepID=A0A8D8MZR7_CULPI